MQIDAIWDCTTDQEIRQALADLPENLTETYRRCATRVRKPLGPRVLSYVCATLIPFQIAELQEILAIDATTGKLLTDSIPQERAIMKSCAGLITRSEDGLILPTHHSVNLFLEKQELPLGMHEGKFNIEDLRLTLGELCVKHLTGPDYSLQISAKEPQFTMDLVPGSFLQAPLLPSWSRFPGLLGTKKKTPINFDASMAAAIRKSRPKLSHLSAFRYARTSWALLTRQISPQSSSWQNFKELVLGKHLSWDVLPWSPPGQSLDSRYQDILGWAIMKSHQPMLHTLLHESIPKPRKEIFDLPLPQYEGCLPIELATRVKSIEVFKSLLPQCTSLNIPRLMCLVAESGFVHGIDAILDFSHYRIQYVANEETPLAVAVRLDHYDFVARLFRTPFQPDVTQMLDALSVASRTGNCNMIQALLRLGASIKLRPDEAIIPLSEASRYQHVDAMIILLQEGPKLYCRSLNPLLLEAVGWNHIGPVQALLDHGAEPNYASSWRTLLHLAIENEKFDMVQLLLQEGADPNGYPNVEPTPLELAAKKALFPIAQLLLADGAKMHGAAVRTSRKATILHWASIGGSVEILKAVASAEAEFPRKRWAVVSSLEATYGHNHFVTSCEDHCGRSEIMIAAALGHVSALKYLIEHGSSVNGSDQSGKNVLMYACGAELQNDIGALDNVYPGGVPSEKPDGYTAMVEILCSRGAKIHDCDEEGKTAFMYAARQFNLGTLKLLRRYGVNVKHRANVKGKGCYRQNALSYATDGVAPRIQYLDQYLECIEYLKDLGL